MRRFTIGLTLWLAALSAAPAPAARIDPKDLPEYVHPPVLAPAPDGVKLDVPPELGNQQLARLGFVDVTAAPFAADPTGRRDSTAALNRAIAFARDAQMVCWFPGGTYAVSGPLECRHGIVLRSNLARIINSQNHPCVLMGSAKGGQRPRIVLAPNSAGYGDPAKPKYVIDFQIFPVKDNQVDPRPAGIDDGSYNMMMNSIFQGIDVEIGAGNPGAIGIRMQSVEGAAMQDVAVDATHGYAGIRGAAGNGGSWANIKVVGGRIGIDMVCWTPPTPTMAGVTLLNQTEQALVSRCRGPLIAVGLKIFCQTRGPAVHCRKGWAPFDGGACLVDSQIEFSPKHRGYAGALTIEGQTFLNDVYVYKGATVARPLSDPAVGWLGLPYYAEGEDQKRQGMNLQAPVYMNGVKRPKQQIGTYADGRWVTKPPVDLQSRHVWGADFPTWETPGAANVKAAPYLAKGDGFADDAAALQRAIDENEIVFLPKGYYNVTRTLRLKPHTKLLGAAQHLSTIMTRDVTKFKGAGPAPWPLVATADDPAAETVIAFCGIRAPTTAPLEFAGEFMPVYSLRWMCGARSIYRTVLVHPLRLAGFHGDKKFKTVTWKHPAVVITGNGAGKWYNYHTSHGHMSVHRDNRCISIKGKRGGGPLRFYNFEPQLCKSDALAEIRDSRDVSIYGVKTECDTTFMWVRDSDDISIYGHGGTGNPQKGGALYRVENTPNFLIANIADQMNLKDEPIVALDGNQRINVKDYHCLTETFAGKTFSVPPLERPVLYMRGKPHGIEFNEDRNRGK